MPPAPIPAIQPQAVRTPAALFPLDEGDVWTYGMRVQSLRDGQVEGESEGTLTYRVERVSPDGRVAMVLEQGGKAIDRQVWRSTPSGLYQVASGLRNVPLVPEQPVALLPLDAGRRFRWRGTGMTGANTQGPSRATSEILAPQNVDTGLGTMSAVPIVSRTDYAGGRIDSTSWFRPGVGLVRLRQETPGRAGRRDVVLLTIQNYAIKRT